MSQTQIDASTWVAMVQNLAGIAGRDVESIMPSQIGQLMKACIKRTPERRPGMIAKRASGNHIKFSDGTVISIWKKADHACMYLAPSTFDPKRNPKTPAPHLIGGMSWHSMNDPRRHWNKKFWAGFRSKERRIEKSQEKLTRKAKKKDYRAMMRARGMAKKTWWQIAESLGCDPSIAPVHVRNAVSPDGLPHIEGTTRRILESAAIIIEMTNANPLVVGKLNGFGIIAGGLSDREKAFLHDSDKEVFANLEQRAKRYPGVFITSG